MIGSGEPACIATAKHRGGIFFTDDFFPHRTSAAHGVLVSGTIGILEAMCIDNHISRDAADVLLAGMVVKEFRSQFRRISDLL